MEIINGTAIAEALLDDVARAARALEKKMGRRPSLAVILVGNDPASHLYVKLKQKAAQSVGIDFHVYRFTHNETEDTVMHALSFLREDDDVDAILIQMPLPDRFDTDRLIETMGAQKDVDGFHPHSEERFLAGTYVCAPVFPRALLRVTREAMSDLAGKRATLVVNSERFGRVLAAACRKEGMITDIILAQKVPCLQAALLSADIIITACGIPGLITDVHIKNEAVVIDGGISKVNGKTVGDVDVESVQKSKKDITLSPVPGGVGPVTVACLMDNVIALARERTMSQKHN